MADVAKGTGSLVKANQARTHARAHTHTHTGFGNEAISLRATLLELTCLRSCPLPLPLLPRSLPAPHFVPSYPPTSLSASSPLAPAIEVYIYIYIYARISPVSGEKKGVFLEITTGEYLEEEHPSRFRSGGERGGSRCRERILSREWEEDGEGGRCVRK